MRGRWVVFLTILLSYKRYPVLWGGKYNFFLSVSILRGYGNYSSVSHGNCLVRSAIRVLKNFGTLRALKQVCAICPSNQTTRGINN